MDVKEAPEKIYMKPSFWEPENVSIAHFSKSQFDFNIGIEYTRTDAFIEKAEKYLIGKFINDVSVLDGGVVGINFDAAISNFVKYMKGE